MRTLSPLTRIILAAAILLSLAAPAAASPNSKFPISNSKSLVPNITVDGVIDAAYGPPLASDPAGDHWAGNTNIDLLDLYMAEEAGSYYFAFTVNANVQTTNWGKYNIYVDTTNDANGAPTDAWTRNVVVQNPHKPEFSLNSWVSSPYNAGNTQFWQWNGSAWSQNGTVDEAASVAGATSTIEWRVAKSRLGSPSSVWVEVWSTGAGDNDNAQDTINDPADDWNATDWTTQSILLNSTQFPAIVPVELTVTSPVEGYYTDEPALDVSGAVSPTVGVDVSVNVNGAAFFNPSVNPDGTFTQPITLSVGLNTITVTADDGVNTNEIVRHVDLLGAHDDRVLAGQLAHDSRAAMYRAPAGPVPAATLVTLRLRAASGDLTGARVRVYNDRINSQSFLDMHSAADDGLYEYWEATLPPSLDPTVYWYRFITADGADTVYYEDDARRTGGVGQAFDASADNSWQLTMYDAAFVTPDWVKNAVVYQIFPDRFRDGDTSNDTPAGSFFYNEPGGTITRSLGSDWNTVVCDPRQAGDCAGTWSKNFYGGDLQGLIDQLDYLAGLGVTAIYLNPVFESPSNHKYDATDYSVIDDNFGDLALFEQFVSAANGYGIHVILDGVFNHTSSDSIYFDRYGRYTEVGACESQSSPYRGWYYFQDVTPGTGQCVSSSGVANAATYTSWFGYDSLPKLDSTNPEVRDLIWSGGANSIGRYWLDANRADGWRLDVGGDVDPGTLNDPANLYWEGFRDAVHQTNPEGFIAGEEWGNATSWTIGGEWDAVMNYQFAAAALSFWRDEPFVDNDHNSGSASGILEPLMPSQLNERLLNLQERYAPEALYAMLNLLDSHDTSRALFMLDHNTDLNDPSLYQNPAYDWSDAIIRLKGVVLLQMTLPGAPTVYYGDEVGLVGPPAYDNGKWEDDPYNRQPFPWLDESGAPFYTHLQTQNSQDALKDYYTLLASTRNQHPALRTGSFDPLLVDDPNMVYAYGRMMPDRSDLAVVILNRQPQTQTVNLDVSGYLPFGAQVVNVLDNNAAYTVSPVGILSLDAPGMSGALLVAVSAPVLPPAAVSDLSVTAEPEGSVVLGWSAAAGADSYEVYRSILSGGGYENIGETASSVFTDTGLANGEPYYYVLVSRDAASGLGSGYSNEASGIPHPLIDDARLHTPMVFTHTIGITATEYLYGRVHVVGAITDSVPSEGMIAQLAFAPTGTLPVSFTGWAEASFTPGFTGEADEFRGQLIPEETGDFWFLYRFSNTAGRDWVYADFTGMINPTALPSVPGVMHVVPSDDLTPPQIPQNLVVLGTSAAHIEIGWDANPEPDIAGYEVYRANGFQPAGEGPGPFAKVGRVWAPEASYTDENVTANADYTYYLSAFDRNFNFSGASQMITATAEARPVAVTFNVTVPAYSVGTLYFSRDVNEDGTLGGWNPAGEALTKIDATHYSVTLTILDGTTAEYKITRGNWETVEKEADGNSEIPNRSVLVAYGESGAQTVDVSVANWRDPLVTAFSPADGATGVPTDTQIAVTWSQTMPQTSDFSVVGPHGAVAGTFSYDSETKTITFTPTDPLEPGRAYSVTVTGEVDAGGDVQQVTTVFTFTTAGTPVYKIWLPVIWK